MLSVFEKSERLRHIGHLDLMRAMQRALRRSGLPVSYSKGFNPHVLLTFASALSVGAVGKREIMDVTLDADVTPEEFLSAMNKALPPEMQLLSARVIDDRHPALMAMVAAAAYDIRVTDEEAARKMIAALPAFLAQETIITPRRTKSGVKDCDIKPLIYSLTGRDGHLYLVGALNAADACKPDMLIAALSAHCGCEAPRTLVTRTGLLGETAPGALAPLETL